MSVKEVKGNEGDMVHNKKLGIGFVVVEDGVVDNVGLLKPNLVALVVVQPLVEELHGKNNDARCMAGGKDVLDDVATMDKFHVGFYKSSSKKL